MSQLLMPKATAVWLVDNTALTFEQIAEFCGLHHLEVKSIADGDTAQGIKGLDPTSTGQLSRDAIKEAEDNPNSKLAIQESNVPMPEPKKKGPRYTPVSKRQDRPSAILWLVRNHPELKDAQIVRLVGTTKGTITAIRDRTHWNISNLQPLDPVTLGISTQIDLDKEVEKAAKYVTKEQEAEKANPGTLLPAEETQDIGIADVNAGDAGASDANADSNVGDAGVAMSETENTTSGDDASEDEANDVSADSSNDDVPDPDEVFKNLPSKDTSAEKEDEEEVAEKDNV